ncbi:L,D-transpeptidase [Pantanalinema rosaneae CENA516]|uniref:L,D-transpeptidase n=1 Tax=Pantanalinema rosaneae TaxID=1620701 RepID=UPI003D702109
MSVKTKDEFLPRSMMWLCMGTAVVLLLAQWQVSGVRSRTGIALLPGQSLRTAHRTSPPGLPTLTSQRQAANGSRRLMPPTTSAKGTTSATASRSPLSIAANSPTLLVDLSDRQVYVYRQSRLQASYPLAIGQAGWETPTGSFQIHMMEREPDWVHPITGEVIPAGDGNPLGKRWLGFWSDGQLEIGFHGTDQEELIGSAVSHGCLRMRNADVIALYEQVSIGTPVVVQP